MNTQNAKSLRNLYFTRTAFQLIWAASVAATVSKPQVAAALLVIYPLWDVACTLYDVKTSNDTSARSTQIVNAVLGVATAIAIALAAKPAYAVVAFGVWALAAGLLQLAVGVIRRRQLGGQWAMILSGAQSSAAGIAFVLGGLSGKLQIKDLGGYAIFGAAYFLIGGLLLNRKISSAQKGEAASGLQA